MLHYVSLYKSALFYPERTVSDKRSSLFLPFVSYEENNVVNTAPG